MVIDDSQKIINKIKSFRPFFQTGNSKKEDTEFLKTWHKVFEPYIYDDVDKALDSFFSSDNFGKTPDPYQLVKGLLTEKEKQKLQDKNSIRVYCPLCKKPYGLSELDIHYDRCSSINYIVSNRQKYFGKSTNMAKLNSLTDKQLDEFYMKFIRELREVVTSQDELNAINKLLSERKL
ncbi:MAG: hypothetical protein HFH45_03450 [Bacilli bacterium]|nr:hypothetical protein [Bacilli bacterium]